MKFIIALAIAMLISVPSFASLSLVPSQLMFGHVKVDGYGYNQRSATLRNISNKTVRIQVSGYCPFEFRVDYGSCYTIYPNGSCAINVNFDPSRAGNYSCTLTVRDLSGSSTSYLSISGYGVK